MAWRGFLNPRRLACLVRRRPLRAPPPGCRGATVQSASIAGVAGHGAFRGVRMSIRAGRVLILVAAGLVCLGSGLAGCSSWKKLDDTSSLDNPSSDSAATGWLTGSTPGAAPDTTGSIVTQPAEPGPSGEPVAPLSKPGLLGDDPNDDVQLGKKYFRGNNFALAENSFHSAVEKHPQRRRSLGRARRLLRPAAPLRSRRPRLCARHPPDRPDRGDAQRRGLLLHAARRLRRARQKLLTGAAPRIRPTPTSRPI